MLAEKPKSIKQGCPRNVQSTVKNHIILMPTNVGAGGQSPVTLFRNPLVQHFFAPTHPCVQPSLCYSGSVTGFSAVGQAIGFQPFGYFFFCVTHVTSLSKIPQLPNLIQQGIFLKCATRQDVQDPAQGLADFVLILCFDKAHLVEGLDIG